MSRRPRLLGQSADGSLAVRGLDDSQPPQSGRHLRKGARGPALAPGRRLVITATDPSGWGARAKAMMTGEPPNREGPGHGKPFLKAAAPDGRKADRPRHRRPSTGRRERPRETDRDRGGRWPPPPRQVMMRRLTGLQRPEETSVLEGAEGIGDPWLGHRGAVASSPSAGPVGRRSRREAGPGRARTGSARSWRSATEPGSRGPLGMPAQRRPVVRDRGLIRGPIHLRARRSLGRHRAPWLDVATDLGGGGVRRLIARRPVPPRSPRVPHRSLHRRPHRSRSSRPLAAGESSSVPRASIGLHWAARGLRGPGSVRRCPARPRRPPSCVIGIGGARVSLSQASAPAAAHAFDAAGQLVQRQEAQQRPGRERGQHDQGGTGEHLSHARHQSCVRAPRRPGQARRRSRTWTESARAAARPPAPPRSAVPARRGRRRTAAA